MDRLGAGDDGSEMSATSLQSRRRRAGLGGPVAPGQHRQTPPTRFSPMAKAAIVYMIVMTQIPFVITVILSTWNWNLLSPEGRGFVGLANYGEVFRTGGFGTALWNTARMTIGVVALMLILGTVLALLLNRRFMGRSIVRTMIFCAFLVPPTAAALIWKSTLLHPSNGLLGFLLSPFGGVGVDWINTWPMGVVIAVTAWQWTPFAMLIVLSGLQNVDQSAREAAMMDGAGPIRIFGSLTLPHLRPHLEVSALLGAIFVSQLLDPIFMITQGGPGDQTTTAAYRLHSLAFRSFDIGLASAFGVIQVFVTIAATLLLLRFAVKSIREGL